MVAYLPSRLGHAAAHWCPTCGAMCWRDYRQKTPVDKWQHPVGSSPAPKAKRPR